MKQGMFSIQNLNEILSSPKIKPFVERLQPTAVVATVKGVVDDISREFKTAATEWRVPDFSELTEKIVDRLQKIEQTTREPEIDATGIVFRNEFETQNPVFPPSVVEKMIWRIEVNSSALTENDLFDAFQDFSNSPDSDRLQESETSSNSNFAENLESARRSESDSNAPAPNDSEASFAERAEFQNSNRAESNESVGNSSDFQFFQRNSTQTTEIDKAVATICRLTGAEDALILANPFLARLAVVQTFCQQARKRVLIARRDLYETDEGDRLEQFFNLTGAKFKETGASDRSTVDDYANACFHKTGLIYFAVGRRSQLQATLEKTEISKLKEKTSEFQIPLFCELEFASIVDLSEYCFDGVPVLSDYKNKGFDLILFRTSQLIGGPDCGVLLGSKRFLDKIRSLALIRSFAPRSTDVAGLIQILSFYVETTAFQNIPVLRKIAVSADNIKNRASRVVPQLKTSPLIKDVCIISGESFLFPQAIRGRTPTFLISIEPSKTTPRQLAKTLKNSNPSLDVRWNDRNIFIDLRTVPPQFDAKIVDLFDV